MSFLGRRPAFTLIELLLVIGIVGVLSSIVIVAVNPGEQLMKARDAKRTSDVKELQSALSEYFIKEGAFPNGGDFESGSMDAARPICKQGTTHVTCINIDALVPDYIAEIPQDAMEPCTNHSGYKAYQDEDGRPFVVASRIQEVGGLTTCLWDGLVGYWPMHERTGTSTIDMTGANHNGTLVNQPSWTNGKVGGGVQFDGTSDRSITVADNADFSYVNGLTYAAWIYPTAVTQEYNMMMGEFLPYFCVRSSRRVHFSVTTGGVQRNVIPVQTVSLNEWHHVAATVEVNPTGPVSTITVYIDGVPEGSAQYAGAIANNGYSHYIGKWTNNSTYPFIGVIDDARIYSRALSATEIAALAAGAMD